MSTKVKDTKDKESQSPITIKKKFYRTENKYDPYLIKDTIQTFIVDNLKKQNIKEDYTFQNFKCILGVFIIANTIFSHYHSIPWPSDYYILAVCIVLYYVLTGIYVQYEQKKEQDLFFLFEIGKQKFAYGFKLLPETSKGTLRLVSYPDHKTLSTKELELSKCFDVDGYLNKKFIKKVIQEMNEQGKINRKKQ